MRFARRVDPVLLALAVGVVAGCGGNDSAITGPEDVPNPNYVRLQSDAQDFIGLGRSYDYSQANAIITLTVTGRYLDIRVRGDEQWFGDFVGPSGTSRLQPGTYSNLRRYPFHDQATGGLSWYGEGRGCNTLTGSFTVDSVRYDNDNLAAIHLRFEQHCEGGTAALRGTIHWRSDDTTRPPGPITPVPAGLWRPSAGSTPSSGDYVYLQSDAGDYIGGGLTYTYTRTNSAIGVTTNGGHLTVSVSGWGGDFLTMNTLNRLEPGYYPDLRRYPFHNPTKGGLNWSGQGRGCNTLLGWFAIDRVTYTNDTVTGLDLRFEQHCEGGTAALYGAIHWGG